MHCASQGYGLSLAVRVQGRSQRAPRKTHRVDNILIEGTFVVCVSIIYSSGFLKINMQAPMIPQ